MKNAFYFINLPEHVKQHVCIFSADPCGGAAVIGNYRLFAYILEFQVFEIAINDCEKRT